MKGRLAWSDDVFFLRHSTCCLIKCPSLLNDLMNWYDFSSTLLLHASVAAPKAALACIHVLEHGVK